MSPLPTSRYVYLISSNQLPSHKPTPFLSLLIFFHQTNTLLLFLHSPFLQPIMSHQKFNSQSLIPSGSTCILLLHLLNRERLYRRILRTPTLFPLSIKTHLISLYPWTFLVSLLPLLLKKMFIKRSIDIGKKKGTPITRTIHISKQLYEHSKTICYSSIIKISRTLVS